VRARAKLKSDGMTYAERGRQKRRLTILRGIGKNLKHSEIAAQLGVNRWTIKNDVRFMRYNRDPGLKQAERTLEQTRDRKRAEGGLAGAKVHARQDERFLRMTGMTLQEKTFRNMIAFYRPELMKVLKARDQNTAIRALQKSVRKTLVHNGIIKNLRITPRALEHLKTDKEVIMRARRRVKMKGREKKV